MKTVKFTSQRLMRCDYLTLVGVCKINIELLIFTFDTFSILEL